MAHALSPRPRTQSPPRGACAWLRICALLRSSSRSHPVAPKLVPFTQNTPAYRLSPTWAGHLPRAAALWAIITIGDRATAIVCALARRLRQHRRDEVLVGVRDVLAGVGVERNPLGRSVVGPLL